jgi:uncharacterized integral membrane protein
MLSRLIGLIVILGILLVFIGFNLDNSCDISFGIAKFSGVPIYLTVFASFMLGMLCSLVFVLLRSFGKRMGKPPKSKDKADKPGSADTPQFRNEDSGPYGID